MNVPSLFKLLAVCSLGFIASGCAPMIAGGMNASLTDSAVADKTAAYFGTSPNKVAVTAISKGALTTAYQTTYLGKLYNCTIYYGEVTCKQPGV